MNSLFTAQKGFSSTPKRLNHTFLYNDDSGALFDAASKEQPYYVHYNDLSILADNAARIAELAGKNRTFVEFCAGLCDKSVPLVEAFEDLESFVANDVDKEVLKVAETNFKARFPDLKFHHFVADVFKPMQLPPGNARFGLLACSMVGCFKDDGKEHSAVLFSLSFVLCLPEAVTLLRSTIDALGDGGVLLSSFDTNQDPETVLMPYRTPKFTEFVLSICDVMNKEYEANFDKSAYEYSPGWNPEESQVEHNIVAKSRQVVKLGDKEYIFEKGERMVVYQTKKRSFDAVIELVRKAGGSVKRSFYDKNSFICYVWIEKEEQ